MPLVACNEFLLIYLDGSFRPVITLDWDFEFEVTCLIFGGFGLGFRSGVIRAVLFFLGLVSLFGRVFGFVLFLFAGHGGISLRVVGKELDQIISGVWGLLGLSIAH